MRTRPQLVQTSSPSARPPWVGLGEAAGYPGSPGSDPTYEEEGFEECEDSFEGPRGPHLIATAEELPLARSAERPVQVS